VSPQYHVVFDKRFSTILSESEEFDHSDWEKLFDIGYERYLYVHPDDGDSDVPIILPPDVDMWPTHSRKTHCLDEFSETGTQATVPTEDSSAQTDHDGSVRQREIPTQTSEDEDVPRRERTIHFDDEVTVRDVPSEPDRQVSRTRSGRQVRRPRFDDEIYTQRLNFAGKPYLSKQTLFSMITQLPRVRGEKLNEQCLALLRWEDLKTYCPSGTLGAYT
jgi:hypothetical protein